MGYDSWLVAPFEQQEAENERYFQFCETHALEVDDPKSEEMYQEYCQDLSEAQADLEAERLEWQREHEDFDYWEPF